MKLKRPCNPSHTPRWNDVHVYTELCTCLDIVLGILQGKIYSSESKKLKKRNYIYSSMKLFEMKKTNFFYEKNFRLALGYSHNLQCDSKELERNYLVHKNGVQLHVNSKWYVWFQMECCEFIVTTISWSKFCKTSNYLI